MALCQIFQLVLENECIYIEQVVPFYVLDLICYLNPLDTGIYYLYLLD